jgi:GDP-L-fucose synthase
MINKFHEIKIKREKEVIIWGTGKPKREFLYSDDLATACVFLMNNYSGNEIINIGSSKEVSIEELSNIIKRIVGFTGNIVFDSSEPDGTPKKLLDSSKIHKMGWKHQIDLENGLKMTYQDFLKNPRIRR